MLYYVQGGEKVKERLLKIRKEQNLTQDEFAGKLGLSKNYIWQIEKGERNPSDRTIKDVCRTFRVNYDWLVDGIGDMYQDDDGDAQAIIDSVLQGENEFARKTLLAFAKMSEEQWELIKDLVNKLKSE